MIDHPATQMSLYDAQGHRTYLTAEERDAFLGRGGVTRCAMLKAQPAGGNG